MSTTFSKLVPSGSTNGMGIKIAATATLGTTFHTAIAGTVSFDEIWLYLFNSDTSSRVVTIEYGDASAPDHNIVQTIQPKSGLVLAVPGLILNNGKVVTVFADATNVVTMSGFINRITVV